MLEVNSKCPSRYCDECIREARERAEWRERVKTVLIVLVAACLSALIALRVS